MNGKRVLGIALAAVALAVLAVAAGCGTSTDTLDEGDSGSTVSLGVGDRIEVTLPSNQTTGYQWVVTDLGPLTQVGESEYDAPSSTGVVGAGGTEKFTFEAKKTGSGTLTLEYRRAWEKDVPAEEAWSVTVEVN
jgi:inhibitor of cysteine peptidase